GPPATRRAARRRGRPVAPDRHDPRDRRPRASRAAAGGSASVTGILSIFTDLRTLVLFIATFTLIVAVHEFGHFAAARLLGMKVLEFAFGFPPRIAAIRRGETEYTLNWIPFGGFVRILGQDDFSIRQQGTGDPRSFTSKPWWAQAIVLAAGVFMNFVLAFVILTAAFATGTTAPTGDVRVVSVSPGSPAAAAGIR